MGRAWRGVFHKVGDDGAEAFAAVELVGEHAEGGGGGGEEDCPAGGGGLPCGAHGLGEVGVAPEEIDAGGAELLLHEVGGRAFEEGYRGYALGGYGGEGGEVEALVRGAGGVGAAVRAGQLDLARFAEEDGAAFLREQPEGAVVIYRDAWGGQVAGAEPGYACGGFGGPGGYDGVVGVENHPVALVGALV